MAIVPVLPLSVITVWQRAPGISWGPSTPVVFCLMADKDVQALVRKLEKLGDVVVTQSGDNHYLIRKGDAAVSLAATPSDHRWRKNVMAELRRAGVNLERVRTPREAAQDRELFILDHLMARKHTTAELTELLNEAGEQIGESGVRARLQRMEARGVIFRANGATQGTEVEWRARSAVPEMPAAQQEEPVARAPEPQVNGHKHDGHDGHIQVSSNIDLAKATATLTITIEGPLDEILEKLAPLVRRS